MFEEPATETHQGTKTPQMRERRCAGDAGKHKQHVAGSRARSDPRLEKDCLRGPSSQHVGNADLLSITRSMSHFELFCCLQ